MVYQNSKVCFKRTKNRNCTLRFVGPAVIFLKHRTSLTFHIFAEYKSNFMLRQKNKETQVLSKFSNNIFSVRVSLSLCSPSCLCFSAMNLITSMASNSLFTSRAAL